MFAAFRKQLSIMTLANEVYLNPTTESVYLDLAKKENFQPDSLVLSDGIKAHWLGPRTADKILIYFHGGGFVLTCSPGHAQWAFDVTQTLAKEHSVSCILLGYTMSTESPYPTQLKQAVELVQYIIEKEGKKPSDIIIGGDSAGGNLTLAVLSHILHPHSKVPTKLNLSEPFRAALLISPWVSFASDDPSFKTNQTTDLIPNLGAERWGNSYLGDAPPDAYNQAILADASWWKGLDDVVKEILIWGGGGEVLIDSINAFSKTLKSAHPKTDYVVQVSDTYVCEVVLPY